MRNAQGQTITLILILLNTLAILLALGVLIYTHFLHTPPKITESSQRSKLRQQAKDSSLKNVKKVRVDIKPMTVNITTKAVQGNPIGHLQYITLGFTLQLQGGKEAKTLFKKIKTPFLDQLVSYLGQKKFKTLNSVQGRYLLKIKMIETINQLAKKPIALDIYFTEFTLK